MKYLSLLILSLFISFVFSEPTIVRVETPIQEQYGSNVCNVIFTVLIDNPTTLDIQTIYPITTYNKQITNGTLTLFTINYELPIGTNQVSVTTKDSQNVLFTFTNYTSFVCEPIPSNLAMTSKSTSWITLSQGYQTLTWLKFMVVTGAAKSVQYDAFQCIVPEPFACSVQEFFNGVTIENYIVTIGIKKSITTYTPFNVLIVEKLTNKTLHSSVFDGLKPPSIPPASISNVQAWPITGSTVIKGDMINELTYTMNILNKNSISNIASNSDYFITSSLFPVQGTPSNAQYIGLSTFQQYTSPQITNVQIIDSQGAKRLSGNTEITVVGQSFESVTDNLVISKIPEPSLGEGSILVDIKINAPYNPKTEINLVSNQLYQVDFSYPFAHSNGTVKYHSLSYTAPVSKYYNRQNYLYTNGIQYQYVDIGTSQTAFSDNKSPNINRIEMINISYEKVLFRIYATDDLSGIVNIQVNGVRYMRACDLVWGTPTNGIYELVVQIDTYLQNNKQPTFQISDLNGNSKYFNSYNPFLSTDFQRIPNYPMFKTISDSNLKPFAFTAFDFKYNDIDLSNQSFNNTLCFNISNANKKMVPRIALSSSPLNPEFLSIEKSTIGSWDSIKEMFCVEFTIPARLFTGEIAYGLYFTPFAYDSYYLQSYLGTKAQLRVFSSVADQMPPIITELQTYPSNQLVVSSGITSIGWNIKIEDSLNGLLEAEFNITSDFDLQPYTIKLTVANLISGNDKSGNYQLRIPVSNVNCKAQKYKISSAYIKDTQGHTSISPSSLNVNPFFKFIGSNQLSISTTCQTDVVVDSVVPVLSSFTVSKLLVDVGNFIEFRDVVFTFSTTDLQSGISVRHAPVIYLSPISNKPISKQSTLVSNLNGVAQWTCTISLPYGFAAYENLLISIYGITDNQLNINGYSTTDLKSLGYQYTIGTGFSNLPVLESTSSIRNTESTLTIYGHKFGINPSAITLQIDYQNGQGYKNTSISFFSGIILITNGVVTPTLNPFLVRVIINGTVISNSLLVTPIGDSPCQHQVTQSVVAQWVNSEKYYFTQASITIKNTGTRPMKLFAFTMEVNQIWGVDVLGNNRYQLPSYNPIINPRDSYSFGYIIESKNVGELQQITYVCL